MNKTKNISILSKSYVDKFGHQHLNCLCNKCGKIFTIEKYKLYNKDKQKICDCENK